MEHAYTKDDGLAVLYGNIAQDGAIIRIAGIDEELFHTSRVALSWLSRRTSCVQILSKNVKERRRCRHQYEGPKGRPRHAGDAIADLLPEGPGPGQKCTDY